MLVRTPPHHDAEEPSEVRGVHDDHNLVGRQLLLLHDDMLQLPLHPLGTAAILLCDLLMILLAMGELSPDLLRMALSLLTELFAARFALPNLSTVVCSKFLEIG